MSTDTLTPARNSREDKRPNAAIEADLRAAWEAAGTPCLTGVQYDAVRLSGSLTRIAVMHRYGSWRAACLAADVEPGKTRRASYSRTWTRDDLFAAVGRYLRSDGATGSYADYERWAKGDPAVPSGQTLRNYLGTWNEIKAEFVSR